MVYVQYRICPKNETHKILLDFEIETDCLISSRQPPLEVVNKKKITCPIADFVALADHRVIQGEKRDKYLDFARELKYLWNIKVSVVPIAIDALGPITK